MNDIFLTDSIRIVHVDLPYYPKNNVHTPNTSIVHGLAMAISC